MADFQPVKMTRKRDGASTTATTRAEQVAAEFDGYTVSAGSKAAATRRATKKTSARKPQTDEKGGPAAGTASTTKTTTSTPAAVTAK